MKIKKGRTDMDEPVGKSRHRNHIQMTDAAAAVAPNAARQEFVFADTARRTNQLA